MRKFFACLMAVIITLSAFTVTAYFTADAVSIVDPSAYRSSSGTLGTVEAEVVDIPDELLESVSSESSEETSLASSSSSGSVSSRVDSPAVVPSNSSTVSIPDNLFSSATSEPSSSSSRPSSTSSESSSSSSESPSVSSEPSSNSSASSNSSSSKPSSSQSAAEPAAPAEEMLIVKISTEPAVGAYPVSEILPKIVGMEMDGSMADEALKAQAVATHSYIKYQNSIGKAPVVSVRKNPSTRIKNLVNSVKDQMMYYNGKVINAAYTASTAGRTESSADVWGGTLPYLTSVESIYDEFDPNWGSTLTFTVDQVKEMVETNAGIILEGDPAEWFKVVTRTAGGYNGEMTIGGQKTFTNGGKTYKITGRHIQTTILRRSGSSALKSHKFDVTVDGDKIIFTTYGYGHGVGMSQWGAHYYAVKGGYTYDQILKHYYSGVTIK